MGGMRPMLATKGTHVPARRRVAARGEVGRHAGARRRPRRRRSGELHIRSRNENDVTVVLPRAARRSPACGRDLLLDGEVVAFLDGVPTFGALADRMHVAQRAPRGRARRQSNPVTLLVFDLLRLDGEDLTGRPLSERRELLEGLGLLDVHWQVPAAYDDGDDAARGDRGSRGSRASSASGARSRYRPGRAQPDWLKFPHRAPRLVRRRRLAARDRQRLPARRGAGGGADRGRAGLPRPGRQRHRRQGRASGCSEVLGPLRADASARSPTRCPRSTPLGTVWVEPEVVVDVAALGMTPAKRLRQPSYRGVRTDLDARTTWRSGDG